MTFKMSLLVTADAKQAKAEMAALAGEQKKVTTSAAGMGSATQGAATGLKAVEGGAKGAATGLGTLAQAEAKAVAGAVQLGQAGATTGSLLGGMGRSVGAALLGLFNPITLITTAVVTVGTAMVGWLMSGQSEAEVLKEKFESLARAVDDFVASSAAADAPTDQMIAKYGSLTAAAREALEAMSRVNQERAKTSVADATQAAVDSLTVNRGRGGLQLADDFDMDTAAAARLLAALKALDGAQTLQGQAAAALQVQAAIDSAGLSAEQMEGGLSDAYDRMSELTLAAGETQGALEAAAQSNLAGVFAAALGPASALLGTVGSIVDGLIASKAMLATQADQQLQASLNYGKILNTGESGADAARRSVMKLNTVDTTPTTYGVRIPSGGGGGGGGGAAQAEANAIGDLIAKQEQELAILRETDPVQKELIRLRETLATGTQAQRDKVVELTTAIEAEKAAAEDAAKSGEFLGQTLGDALISIGMNGGDATDAIDNLKKALLQASLQALILGEGPLAGLFGTAGTSIFGSLFGGGASVPALAGGGMIQGPGTGTSDDVLMYGSNGEFVVNAAATARHRGLLEAINGGGGVPAFARGGMIGGGGSGSTGGRTGGGGLTVNVVVNGARGNGEIRQMVEQGVAAGIRANNREVVPLIVRKVAGGDRSTG